MHIICHKQIKFKLIYKIQIQDNEGRPTGILELKNMETLSHGGCCLPCGGVSTLLFHYIDHGLDDIPQQATTVWF